MKAFYYPGFETFFAPEGPGCRPHLESRFLAPFCKINKKGVWWGGGMIQCYNVTMMCGLLTVDVLASPSWLYMCTARLYLQASMGQHGSAWVSMGHPGCTCARQGCTFRPHAWQGRKGQPLAEENARPSHVASAPTQRSPSAMAA